MDQTKKKNSMIWLMFIVKSPALSISIILLFISSLYVITTSNYTIVYTKSIGTIEGNVINGMISEVGPLTVDRSVPAIWYVTEQGKRYTGNYRLISHRKNEEVVNIQPVVIDLESEGISSDRIDSREVIIEVPIERQTIWNKLVGGMS